MCFFVYIVNDNSRVAENRMVPDNDAMNAMRCADLSQSGSYRDSSSFSSLKGCSLTPNEHVLFCFNRVVSKKTPGYVQ